MGLICTCLFSGCGAYDINNFGSVHCFCQLFFTLNMAHLNKKEFEALLRKL